MLEVDEEQLEEILKKNKELFIGKIIKTHDGQSFRIVDITDEGVKAEPVKKYVAG